MPLFSSTRAADQDHADACDGGARSSLASRWRRFRATIGLQSALPAGPCPGSPSTSSSVSASSPPLRRQIHECPITSKGSEEASQLQEKHAGREAGHLHHFHSPTLS